MTRWIVLLLIAVLRPVSAQGHSPAVPVRDLYVLAERLTGVSAALPTPLMGESPVRAVGDTMLFRVLNLGERAAVTVPATLRAVGDQVYLWLEDGAFADDATLLNLAARLDDEIFPTVRELWGLPSADTPDIDGEAPVHILFHSDPGGGYGGYFSSEHLYPRAIVGSSSEHELLILNTSLINPAVSTDVAALIAAHEYQHLLRYQAGGALALWLNEGLSSFTEYHLTGSSAISAQFYAAPQTSLTRWQFGDPAYYGAALDWLMYLTERCGVDGVRALAQGMNGGQRDLNAALADLPACPLPADADLTIEETMFADWIAARSVQFDARDLRPTEAQTAEVDSGGTVVYTLGPVAAPAALALTSAALLPVLPVETAGPVWRTQRADLQMSELVLADVDLTAASSARLAYRIWHDIEPDFDYGYVLVNDQIVTPVTEMENPHGRAYGPAYTGLSDGWRDQQVDLSPFLGGWARVSFLYVTDDGVQHPGIALSDLRVTADEAVVYDDQTMTPLSAEGWVYSAPLLENRLLVQIMDRTSGALLARHVLTPDDLGDGSVDLPIPAARDGLIVTVSPLNNALEVPSAFTVSLSQSS